MLRKSFWTALSAVLLLCSAGFGQTGSSSLDPAVLQFLPPDAALLLGIEWRKVAGSAAGGLIQNKLQDPALASQPLLQGLEKTLREIDSLTLAAPAQYVAGKKDQAAMLAVVRGRFDRAQIREWLTGKVEIYRRAELIEPAGVDPPTSRVALVDANTVLLGDRAEVMAALDRHVAPPPQPGRPNRLLDRAQALGARYDAWVAMNAPPGGFPSGKSSNAEFLSQLSGLELGISFTQGFSLQANLRGRSSEATKSIASTIQGLLAMATMQQDASRQNADLLRKLQVTQTPSAVSIRLSLTEAEMARSMSGLQASIAKTQPAVQGPAQVSTAPQSDPNRPRKIRILGLEGGTVEVPVGPDKR